MKHLIYSLLQWIQLAAFICPLVLIYKSRTRDHLLWLFAAYLQVNFLFAAFECVLSKYDFSPAVTEQYNIMVNILNMFDGVWCIFIVHYGATGAKLKKTAGNAAMVLFIIECIHALLVGVDVQHAAYAIGLSIIVTFAFQLWWLHEHYKKYFYTQKQKGILYLNLSITINYGTFVCPYFFSYLAGQYKSKYIDRIIMMIIPNVIYLVIASIGIWMLLKASRNFERRLQNNY